MNRVYKHGMIPIPPGNKGGRQLVRNVSGNMDDYLVFLHCKRETDTYSTHMYPGNLVKVDNSTWRVVVEMRTTFSWKMLAYYAIVKKTDTDVGDLLRASGKVSAKGVGPLGVTAKVVKVDKQQNVETDLLLMGHPDDKAGFVACSPGNSSATKITVTLTCGETVADNAPWSGNYQWVVAYTSMWGGVYPKIL